MKVKFNNDVLQLKHPFSIRSSRPKRDLSTFKYKILPSLKTINNVQYQQIDYRAYEKLRKNRKIQLLRPANATQFYLQGQIAYTAPKQKKSNNNQDNLLHLFAKKHNQSTTEKLNSRKRPQRQSSTKSDNIVDTPKLQQNQTNFLHAREMIPLINHKKMPAMSTLGEINKSEIRKKPTVSFINPNKSFQLNKTIDLQKPLLHLDKKQLNKIKAESFIVMQYPSLQVISGCRFKNPAEIASLTKIMTFYTIYGIALQKKIDLHTCLTVIDEEASEMSGTSAELVVGDLLSVEQLLYGLMLPSGNDAAIALAKWGGAQINKSPQQISDLNTFLMKMNKNAKELQMKASFFGNPHGLPNFRNTSNPYDVALLIAKCLKIPLFCKIVKTQSISFWITNCEAKKEVVWENTNKLLRRKGFIGVKTGVTVTAGPCLASCFQKDHKKFIIVLLRTNKLSRRFKQTRYILGWTLRKLDYQVYNQTCQGILKNDAILDSDNSEDEQQFDYEKMDAKELAKRNKILVYQL